MLDSMEVEIVAATSESNLASRLSPYYNTSLSMGFPDSAAIGLGVALAMNSVEEWDPGPVLEADLDAEITMLNQCAAGNLENEQYEVEGITYICLNSQWVMASNSDPRRRSLFHNVSAVGVSPTRFMPSSNGMNLVPARTVAQYGITCDLTIWQLGALVVAGDFAGAKLGVTANYAWILMGGIVSPWLATASMVVWSGAGSYGMYRLIAWDRKAC
jgi:hypothetical protein